MPNVRIEMWPAQSRDQKDALIRNVTQAVIDSIGCPPQAVQVMLIEVDKSDWATGGVCHSESRPHSPSA
jgi:4-oxalocrotonate tautomerase